jgi:hypothetical protein
MYPKRNSEFGVLGLYLGDYKRQFYLREISRLAKLPLKNTQNSLKTLEKRRILKSSVNGKNKYFSLNLDNIQTKLFLLQAEIYKTFLFLEKYPSFKTFLKEVSTQSLQLIFGSFAKFNAGKDSDVDLLIVSRYEEKIPIHLLPYKVHEIRITDDAFRKAMENQEALIKEIEENHVILNNHSAYVNLIWDYYGE